MKSSGTRLSATAGEPNRGERVDSIDYYQRRLALLNIEVASLQREKLEIAERGEDTIQANTWISQGFKFLGALPSEDDIISNDTSAFEPVDSISSSESSVESLHARLITSNGDENEVSPLLNESGHVTDC